LKIFQTAPHRARAGDGCGSERIGFDRIPTPPGPGHAICSFHAIPTDTTNPSKEEAKWTFYPRSGNPSSEA
jgi:hypothetical protein